MDYGVCPVGRCEHALSDHAEDLERWEEGFYSCEIDGCNCQGQEDPRID